MDIELALKEYGLNDKEIKVYLCLLSLGSVNLQEISKRIDLPRTTIYNTLNYLSKKGLTSYIIKKGVRFYQAAEPEKLIENINQKKEIINSVLPELKLLKKIIKHDSSVEIYEGTKGLSTILSDVFKKQQQTYYFGSYSLSKKVLKYQPEHFRTIRLDRNIPAKIVIDEYDEDIFSKKEYQKITEIRFNNSLKDFPCMIFIYGNKVALYTLKNDLIGIIIKNEEVANAIKMIFEIYWNSTKIS
ncbi:MAG: hypothetical protein KC550_00500 [Nanoarchaeota archaeon]|nr:hypothetical protein [Nanoarchaeota archaeon]